MKKVKSKLYALRHANTIKHEDDLARTITPKGLEQAAEASKKLAGVKFDQVMCSCAVRTLQTAQAILGGNVQAIQLDALYRLPDAEGERICNVMFKELGYASLREYYRHELADTLKRFGQNATEAIMEKLTGDTTLIVSHAVLINIVLHEMFTDEQVRTLALDTNLAECGIVAVTIYDDGTATAEVL